MKFIAIIVIALSCAVGIAVGENLKCSKDDVDVPTAWIDMVQPCIKNLKYQVEVEFSASITYLAMAAYFARDGVNRLGFSEFFFKAASEEREHGIKVIEYLLMRGQLTKDTSDIMNLSLKPSNQEWSSGSDALRKALDLETHVTRKIKDIIETCENGPTNDYHLVDYFTADFLDEQLKGQRDLAGKISTLDKMMKEHGRIGEFLFDKELLK